MENTPGLDSILKKIKKHEIDHFNIPRDLRDNIEIIRAERKEGLRRAVGKGYDVINNLFFVVDGFIDFANVKEGYTFETNYTFETFDEYYNFLDGDIYNYACYRFYIFSNEEIEKYKLDILKLKENNHLIEDNIDSYNHKLLLKDKNTYREGKKYQKKILEYKEKIINATDLKEFTKIAKAYSATNASMYIPQIYLFIEYINAGENKKERLSTVISYINKHASSTDIKDLYLLSYLYGKEQILNEVVFNEGSLTTIQRNKHRLLNATNDVDKIIITGKKICFDIKTHFYEVRTLYKTSELDDRTFCFPLYFKDLKSAAKYAENDLRHADLSMDFELEYDFSNCIVDETTRFPITSYDDLDYERIVKYDKDGFLVKQYWRDKVGNIVKKDSKIIEHLFDLDFFLNNDLSNVDFSRCYGLENITDLDGIDLSNSIVNSKLLKRLGFDYSKQIINFNYADKLLLSEQNEIEQDKQEVDIPVNNDIITVEVNKYDSKSFNIGYVTDLHLMHRIENDKCETAADVLYLFNKIIDNLFAERIDYLLIGGDTCNNFEFFKVFIELLSERKRRNVIFILGNHELWEVGPNSVDDVAKKYEELIQSHGMYFLNNELMYWYDNIKDGNYISGNKKFSYNELMQMSVEELNEELKTSRICILGGIGFAGYNNHFNADLGIYRNLLTRDEEINETRKFEQLYNKILPVLVKNNSIVLTHMRKADWCKNPHPDKHIIYVSGHTHKNYAYDDGDIRVYCDNQIGYHRKNVYLKTFRLYRVYDYLKDYCDGVHEISKEQYLNFCAGRNLYPTLNRQLNILYMIKKNGYYAFFHKSASNVLTILNGGALKKVLINDINYYYENMDKMINAIQGPLSIYTKFQEKVAKFVKAIGGDGTIHGAIVDIDFLNHLYVNPYDYKVTPYYALSIVDKTVYPSLPELLKEKCSSIYEKYKLLNSEEKNSLVAFEGAQALQKPMNYYGTDIYSVSRYIMKMQKLKDNVLCTWDDNLINKPNEEIDVKKKTKQIK